MNDASSVSVYQAAGKTYCFGSNCKDNMVPTKAKSLTWMVKFYLQNRFCRKSCYIRKA